jgi:catechol 2,3-dioxygenase-like lactoylglutathione lyase family enzyme
MSHPALGDRVAPPVLSGFGVTGPFLSVPRQAVATVVQRGWSYDPARRRKASIGERAGNETVRERDSMDISLQACLLNVHDLDRSIDFYTSVLDLELASRRERVAILMVPRTGRRQVLILRQALERASHAGGGTIGVRLVTFEVGSLEDLTAIEQRLTERHAFELRKRAGMWEAVFGVDPDRNQIAFSAGTHGEPVRDEDWENVDDLIYSVGE